jgi:hypothetical protein
VLYEDGTFEEHLVALTQYDGSRESAETVVVQIHRIVQFYGVEAVLKVILSDSPGVPIAAVNLDNTRRSAHGLPPVEQALCLIHRINLVCQAFGTRPSDIMGPYGPVPSLHSQSDDPPLGRRSRQNCGARCARATTR